MSVFKSISKLKWTYKVFITIFCMWLLFLAIMPTLLSHGLLEKIVNRNIKGTVHIEKMHLSWFKSQRFEKITLEGSDNEQILSIDSLKTKTSLVEFFFRRKNIQEILVDGLDGNLVISKNNSNNFIESVKKNKLKKKSNKNNSLDNSSYFVLELPLLGKVELDNSKLTLHSHEKEPITLTDIQLNCNADSKKGPLSVSLSCDTAQDELSGSVKVNLELGGFNQKSKLILTPNEKDIFFLAPSGYLNLNTELNNIPSDGIGHLLELSSLPSKELLPALIGNHLNLGLDTHITKGKAKLKLKATSHELDLKFSGTILQNQFFLDEASICKLNIQPLFIKTFLEKYYPQSKVFTKEPIYSQLQIDRLTLPLDFNNFDVKNISCNAQFNIGSASFLGSKKFENFSLKHIKGVIDTFDIAESVSIHVKGVGDDHGAPILAKLDGQITSLIDVHAKHKWENLSLHSILELRDVPTNFLTFLSPKKDIYNEILGPSTQLDLTFNGPLKNGALKAKLSTSRLSIEQINFNVKDQNQLNLVDPVVAKFKVTPQLSTHLVHKGIHMLHPVDMNVNIDELSLNLAKNNKSIHAINAEINFSPIEWTYQNSKPLHIPAATASISNKKTDLPQVIFESSCKLPSDVKLSSHGDNLNCYILVNDLNFFKTSPNLNIDANFKADNWEARFNGKLDSQLNLTLEPGAHIQCHLQPLKIGPFETLKPYPVSFLFEPFVLSLTDHELQDLNISGKMLCNYVVINKANYCFPASNLTLKFDFDGSKDILKLKAVNDSGRLEIDAYLSSLIHKSKLDFNLCQTQIQGKLLGAPITALELLTPYDINYLPILGAEFNANFDMLLQPNMQTGAINCEISSKLIEAAANFEFGPKLFLKEPATIKWTLLEENYPQVSKQLSSFNHPLINLNRPIELTTQINSFEKNKEQKNFDISGEFFIPELSGEEIHLKDLEGSIKLTNQQNDLEFKLTAQHDSKEQTALDLNLNLSSLINPSNLNGNINFTCSELPTNLVHDLICFKNSDVAQLTQLLDQNFNLTAHSKIELGKGPLKVEITSENLSTSIDAEVNRNLITFNDDIIVKLSTKNSTTLRYLEKINPLFEDIAVSDQSLNLNFHKEHSSIALDLDLEQFNFPKIDLNFSDSICCNNKTLKKLTEILKIDNFKGNTKLSPISLSIDQGQMKFNRCDMLIDEMLPIAIWGQHDFKQKESLYYIGLPKSVVKTAFSSAQIPNDFIFQIPLYGVFPEVNTNWSEILTQLNSLNLSSKILSSDKNTEDCFGTQFAKILETFSKDKAYLPAPLMQYDLPWVQKQEPIQKQTDEATERQEILMDMFKQVRKHLK